MAEKAYLAVDMGASSGRHVLGLFDGQQLRLEEVYRFENGPVEVGRPPLLGPARASGRTSARACGRPAANGPTASPASASIPGASTSACWAAATSCWAIPTITATAAPTA